MPHRDAKELGSRVHVWLFAFVLLLLTWLGVFYKTRSEFQVELASLTRNNQNLARVFEEHTIRTIQGVDQSVLFLKYQYEKLGDRIAIADYVKEGLIQSSLFTQVGIINEKGIYTHNNLSAGLGINLSDREHFRVHVAADTGQIHISKPILGRATRKWSLQLTRRINKADGSFGGVVVVSLNPEYLTSFYRQIEMGKQGIVALVGSDGVVRARRQGDEVSFGQDLSASAVIRKAFAEGQGTTENVSRIDGVKRLYSFRKVRDYPLWVFVASGEDEALAEMHSRARLYYVFAGLLSALILGFSLVVTRDIVRRKQAEAVQESLHTRLSLLNQLVHGSLDAASVGAWWIDFTEKDTFHALDTTARLIGVPVAQDSDKAYRISDWAGVLRKAKELEPRYADMIDDTFEKFTGTLEGRYDFYDATYPVPTEDGSVRWINARANVVQRDVGGRALQMTGTLIDITAQKQAEEYLRRTSLYARSLIEASLDPLVTISPEGKITDVNQATEVVTGRSRTDLVGSDFSDYFTDPDNARIGYQQVFSEGKVTDYPLAIRHTSGKITNVLYNATVYRDAAGDVAGVFAAARDITEVQRATAALREKTEELDSYFNSALDLFCIADDQGYFRKLNPAWEETLGYGISELEGHLFLDWLHPDDIASTLEIVKNLFDQKPAIGFINRYRHKDGAYRWIEWRARSKGHLIFAAARDITERIRAEEKIRMLNTGLEQKVNERTAQLKAANEELIQARDAAEAASRAKSTFLANMSHELRTPMNAIMGMTDLALRRAEDPKLRDQLAKVTQASQHLLHVINDILDISKIEAEHLTLEQAGFKLGEVLENLTSLIGHKARDKGLDLLVNVSPGVAHLALVGDPLRLGQILLNLTSNALKFTEQGSIAIGARLMEEGPAEVLLRMEVRDTGIGIAPDDQKRLFNAFEQADGSTTRKYGGTGLGLAISKRLARLMGGEVGVESAVGRGSTFWFTVRLGKSTAAVPSAPAIESGAAEARLRARFSGARVLLAEDEPVNQEVSRCFLEDVGLAVDLAEDGRQAVELAKAHRYDLILMDVQMPNLNGMNATGEIRALPGYERTPILAMTANAFDEDRRACLDAGMNDHIAKPVDPQILFETLFKWLAQSRGQEPRL
ncbi:MAG: PAS domain S-box protein [Rhodocyclaceae bacterium]|nr:PAS domain S-box protein [Rhodocyclaceae bacterium]